MCVEVLELTQFKIRNFGPRNLTFHLIIHLLIRTFQNLRKMEPCQLMYVAEIKESRAGVIQGSCRNHFLI